MTLTIGYWTTEVFWEVGLGKAGDPLFFARTKGLVRVVVKLGAFSVLLCLRARHAAAAAPVDASDVGPQLPNQTQAQSQDTSEDDSSSSDEKPVYTPEPPYVHGTAGFEADGYRYSPRTESEDIYPLFMGRSTGQAEKGWVEVYESSEAMLMSPISQKDHPTAYFELPEGYVATSGRLENIKVLVGRKIEDWNHLDEEWKLGIWQPRYRWDYLRPDTVGLTGLYVEADQPLFHAVLFGSPIFIPERGVPISTSNGQLISSSPWFISPPNNIQVLTQNTPLDYDLQVPPTSEIIFHPSVSAMFRIGDKTGPWMSAGYAYKPMNQLLLGFNGYLALNSLPEVAEVPIVPRVVYHHLVSAEAGYSNQNLSMWVSLLEDYPGKEVTPALTGTWTLQEVTQSTAISPTFEYKIVDPNDNKMKVSASYLYQVGGDAAPVTEGGSAIPGSSSVFEPRYPFHDATMLGGEIEMPGLAHSLLNWDGVTVFSTNVLYDIENRGVIFSFDTKYRPTPRWEGGIGVDLLGSEDAAQAAGEPPDDFIGRYRGNDRIRCGVTYVF